MVGVAYYFIFALFTFFLWNDLSFFRDLAAEQEYVISTNYTQLTQYTVKLRMLDHFGHYIYLPFCTWFDHYFRISSIPWMSPNVVTAVHWCLAAISGGLFASSSLNVRRMGVVMFECRSMLDIMDGVIYRAQSKVKPCFAPPPCPLAKFIIKISNGDKEDVCESQSNSYSLQLNEIE